MGIHERIDHDDNENLPQEFVERCVSTWVKHGQSRDDLARAMLCAAINHLIEHEEVSDVAMLLMALAHQIAPATGAGHG